MAAAELSGAWPYEREHPDLILLGVRPGHAPSALPPVRIFLGTEEGQYRAERVFVCSVEKVRDPGRVYEIHLMKNLAGFNRKGWRTGFTCYRFAIPDLAGRSGRAIYNDVDQIYLGDPAQLFDLPLDGHGYLAIDARDTSVMLIDCAKMLPWWNRAAASLGRKGELTNVPAGIAGLWGRLDSHWNARDLEYVEGRTRCLHYTALHQQPWGPFPEQYSYHPNPLAYIWHDLEREADAAGFELFTARAPSPAFLRLVDADAAPVGEAAAPVPVSAAAAGLLAAGEGTGLLVSLGRPTNPAAGAAGFATLDLTRERDRWPASPVDRVVASGLFERLPPADAGWVLKQLFASAARSVYVQLRAQAATGVGSPEWWERRVGLTAARYAAVSWQLDVAPAEGGGKAASFGRQRVVPPAAPVVWALLGGEHEADGQVQRLADALGWPVTSKRLVWRQAGWLPNLLAGASLAGIDRAASDPLDGPAPDLVLAAGSRSVPVARWIRQRGHGRTRLVQLGRPRAPFELFDLIIATPEQRLPIRRNVLQLDAPLGDACPRAAPAPADSWAERAAALPQPRTAMFVGAARAPYRLDAALAAELARQAVARAEGGGLLVWFETGLPEAIKGAAEAALSGAHQTASGPRDGAQSAYGAFMGLAERLVVHAGDPAALAAACLTGKPVALSGLPRRGDDLPLLRPVLRLVLPLIGGKTYRGTPLQQHFPGRLYDWLVTRGVAQRPIDPDAWHRALEARGRLTRIGAPEPVASPKPLDDLARSVARVRNLLSERSVVA